MGKKAQNRSLIFQDNILKAKAKLRYRLARR